jgi:hypothetical protein
MIPKGNQRAGGQQLATHLLNSYDNDSVDIADVRGAVAPDLHGAFAEWYAESKATKCSKFLYSLSINPDHTQGPFNREHYHDFIRRTEDMLGLSGQPRAVVFHVKHGRVLQMSKELRMIPTRGGSIEVEAAMIVTMRKNGIGLPPSFLTVASNF